MTFRTQSGELIEGIWHQGSFDVALAATDLDGARAEIDKRLADGEGIAWETGEMLRVIGNGQSAYRHLRAEGIDASWT